MEATYSSESSVAFQRTTQRYIPEDKIPQPPASAYDLQLYSHL
jgi:hypothetical protein